MTKSCKLCNKEFKKYPSDSANYWKVKVFCSKKCANNFNKNNRFKKGIPRPEGVKEKIRKSLLGNIPWNKGKPYLKIRGENHHGWKGGITSENHKIRGSLEYKLWRKAVFERDNWTCIWCGQRGSRLNADHIKPFAL